MQREDWDARYAWVDDLWGEANRFLVAEVAELEPGRALDLACGQGRNAIWLADARVGGDGRRLLRGRRRQGAGACRARRPACHVRLC